MTVYLLGNKKGAYGLELAIANPDSQIVLMQDATFFALKKYGKSLNPHKIMAMYDDAEKRGLVGRIPESIRLIQNEEFIDLILQNPVVCFP